MTPGSAPISGPFAGPTVALATSIADVWAFDLSREVDESVLSPDECERAGSFRFDRDRRWFCRRRAHLRHLLASYTGHHARSLRFVAGGYGKPTLVQDPSLHFSASSSADVAMLAVCDHEIGIDVEVVRPAFADADLAQRMFADEETEAVIAGTVADFFRCWTRKEAYVKAVGHGLSFPLRSFAIEVADVARPRLIRSSLRPQDVGSWTVADLSSPTSQVAAALVVRLPSTHVSIRSEYLFNNTPINTPNNTSVQTSNH